MIAQCYFQIWYSSRPLNSENDPGDIGFQAFHIHNLNFSQPGVSHHRRLVTLTLTLTITLSLIHI